MKLIGAFIFVLGLLFFNTSVTALEQKEKNKSDFAKQDNKVSNNASYSFYDYWMERRFGEGETGVTLSDCVIQTENSISKRVKKVVMEELNKKETEVTLTSRFIEDLKANELDTVELLFGMEYEFKLHIPGRDVEKIFTVQEFISYINTRLCKP